MIYCWSLKRALANVRGWQVGAFENLGVGQSGCRLTGGELLVQRIRFSTRTDAGRPPRLVPSFAMGCPAVE